MHQPRMLKMGSKPNLNPSSISNFLSNSRFCPHLSFSRSTFPVPRSLFSLSVLVTSPGQKGVLRQHVSRELLLLLFFFWKNVFIPQELKTKFQCRNNGNEYYHVRVPPEKFEVIRLTLKRSLGCVWLRLNVVRYNLVPRSLHLIPAASLAPQGREG